MGCVDVIDVTVVHTAASPVFNVITALQKSWLPGRLAMEALSTECWCKRRRDTHCNGNRKCLHRRSPSVVTRVPQRDGGIPDTVVRARVWCAAV